MIKGLCTLLLISLLVVAQCNSFKRIPFENGRIPIERNLAATNKATFEITKDPKDLNAGVSVETSDAFRTAHDLKPENKTEMSILLFTGSTGFCLNCAEFLAFKCDATFCKPADNYLKWESPYYRVEHGYPFETTVKIGTGFDLKNPALKYESYYRSKSTTYLTNNKTYGYIGLGAEGDAAKNFVGDHPLFSVKTSRTGSGEIIFADDSSLHKGTKQTISTTGNWTAQVKNISVGAWNRTFTSYDTYLNFDLNVDGLYIESVARSYLETEFQTKYKMRYNSNQTVNKYRYIYNGTLSALPDLVFGMSKDGEALKIPSFAYMRLIEGTNEYGCLIDDVSSYYNYAESKNLQPIVIGNQVMSQFYTVFEVPKEKTPVVALYPTPTDGSPKSSGGSGFIIGVIAVVGLAVVGYIVFKNKAASKLAEHLNK